MSLGDRIRERRMKLGLSQAQLAYKMETESNAISRWETDKVRVSQKYILKLAKALKTSTAYLLGETDDPTSSVVEDSASAQTTQNAPNNTMFGVPQNCAGRLVIKQGDLYINLPETPDGYSALKTFLTTRGLNSIPVMSRALQPAAATA